MADSETLPCFAASDQTLSVKLYTLRHLVRVCLFLRRTEFLPPRLSCGNAGGLPGAERRTRDIDGIGTAVNGRNADVRRPGGRKQFEGPHYLV